jgi:hypothetical protein
VQRLAGPAPNESRLSAVTYAAAAALLILPTITIAAPIVKAIVDAVS